MVELEERVKKDGVVTLTMGELRDAFGYQRLGANIRWMIAQTLRETGIDFLPERLPGREDEMIRLYEASHPVKELIHAALELDPEQDKILAEAARAIHLPERKVEKRKVGRPRRARILTVS